MSDFTRGLWKTGRDDMQSYTGDGETAFTNIYAVDFDHMIVGRAQGDNNKADAKLMAAAPAMVEALQWFLANVRTEDKTPGYLAALLALKVAGIGSAPSDAAEQVDAEVRK